MMTNANDAANTNDRRTLMAERDKALAGGDIARFQALTLALSQLPMKGVRELTPRDIARYNAKGSR